MPHLRSCRSTRHRLDSSPSPDALEQLALIRRTMERSTAFTAVSGWGYIGMGTTALVTASLAIWLGEALVAVTIGLAAMHWKATRQRTHILSIPGRRLFLGLLPALFAGGVMTVALVRLGDNQQIPGIWLLLYGVAVMQAG